MRNQTAKSVIGLISSHRRVYEGRSDDQREEARMTAEIKLKGVVPWSNSRVSCPACDATGVLYGKVIKEHQPKYEDNALLVDTEYLADRFECFVCELRLGRLEEILHAGLEPRFTFESVTDLHELYEPDYFEDAYMNM